MKTPRRYIHSGMGAIVARGAIFSRKFQYPCWHVVDWNFTWIPVLYPVGSFYDIPF